ncbi:MAG: Peptidase M23 family protein [Parcubacteria group bacterium GW2011_GWA1_47_11]|uniref:LysM domain-containing protein n=1 Tax=Candidatus Yanofskybacteria bacterium RIFCSPHIGHO2_01_FULL_48_25b TaxID=1802672 RepID=A0A1F8F1E6_9BACT|nr:MAG: Peptidase M23 family protein [Parcubacteria group bacterium GW2011_GWA1_47_11]OGN06410.1 MAG: hypothetical protein A2669_01435 [Candidatus Yanofskybacteria bacterium RIFCSPHIGHO2_01_FULL_48_25b]
MLRFKPLFAGESAQIALTIGAVLVLITTRSPNQPSIVGPVVRHYIEETSASMITREDPEKQFSHINDLAAAVQDSILGGPEQSSPLDHTFREDSIQAIDAVSTDYLDDYKTNKVAEYTVQPGDAISFIASDYGVSVNSILWANKISSPDNIKPGQILKIPPITGVIHTVQKGDTISDISKKYKAETNRILAFNDLKEGGSLIPGQELIVPDGTITPEPKTAARSSKTSVSAKRFAYLPDLGSFFRTPAAGFNWGVIHGRNGVDVANSCGTPIYAAADGTISATAAVGWNGGFGKYIKVGHPNGTETLYAHLSKIKVSPGQAVEKGQEIGLMGSTGRSTGCHIHFEVHGARNPLVKY